MAKIFVREKRIDSGGLEEIESLEFRNNTLIYHNQKFGSKYPGGYTSDWTEIVIDSNDRKKLIKALGGK